MKIDFSSSVPYVPEWRGNQNLPAKEQVKCDLEMLELGDLMSLVDAFSQAGIGTTAKPEEIQTGAMTPILDKFATILPKHVKNLKGLYDASGKAVGIEDIIKYPVFLNLGVELLMKLAELSSPSDEDEKN